MAVRSAWASMGRCWLAVGSPYRAKILVFNSLVYESGLSCLTAVALSAGDCARIDSVVLSFARKLMGSRSVRVLENGEKNKNIERTSVVLAQAFTHVS